MARKQIKAKKAEFNKAEFLSMRITPKMRFGLELLARHRKTTIGGAVALSVEKMFVTDHDGLRLVPDHGLTPVNILDSVWSPYEHERFAKLAEYAYNLLSDQEKYLWNVVTGTPKYWTKGKFLGGDSGKGEPIHERILNLEALEADWDMLKRRAGIQP